MREKAREWKVNGKLWRRKHRKSLAKLRQLCFQILKTIEPKKAGDVDTHLRNL